MEIICFSANVHQWNHTYTASFLNLFITRGRKAPESRFHLCFLLLLLVVF